MARADREVIRTLRFRPTRIGFDAVIREVLIPALCGVPGVVDAYAGRQGPDELGPRIVATIWASGAAMEAALRGRSESPDGPDGSLELGDERDSVADASAEWAPLSFAHRRPVPGVPTVLRFVHGRVRPGELAAYLEEARAGTLRDLRLGHGPIALYLAAEPPERFRTLSAWPDWSTLQAATGGRLDRPIATRHARRLVDWEASHYEVVEAPVRAEPVPA